MAAAGVYLLSLLNFFLSCGLSDPLARLARYRLHFLFLAGDRLFAAGIRRRPVAPSFAVGYPLFPPVLLLCFCPAAVVR